MNVRPIAAGAVAMLFAHAANATVYFNSVASTNPTAGFNGPSATGFNVSAMADSLTASSPNFSQLSLLLSADNPADGGSTSVFLVPNTGGSPGAAGSPSVILSGGNFVSFNGAQLLGTIADAGLATTGSGTTLATLGFSPAIAASVAAPNQEYWIGLLPSAGSTVEWDFASDNSGSGEASQASWGAFAGGGTSQVADSATSGPFDLIVATPEPASLAILGAGLACLGYFRRRSTGKG